MIVEIIIIICIIGVFVIIARRLPDIIKKPGIIPKTISEPVVDEKKVDKGFWGEQKNPVIKKDFAKESVLLEKEKSNFEKADDFFQLGDYKEAERLYVKAASQDPNNAKIYNRLGIIYLEQKNYRDAKDAFTEALKFDNKKASRYINLGLAHMNLRNFEEALKCFEQAAKMEPKNEKYQNLYKDAKMKRRIFDKKQ